MTLHQVANTGQSVLYKTDKIVSCNALTNRSDARAKVANRHTVNVHVELFYKESYFITQGLYVTCILIIKLGKIFA